MLCVRSSACLKSGVASSGIYRDIDTCTRRPGACCGLSKENKVSLVHCSLSQANF